ncbi:MAG: hypothetical protein GY883_13220 [Shimia sp.]|nr:hypothetical protein [Shimia sp.]
MSPNFEIHAPTARLLTWPAARHWVPLLVGDALGFDPKNEGHATYWTTQYPTVAVMQMAALVAETKDQDFAEISLPAMFMFSDADTVVQPRVTREVAALWGGPVTLAPQILQEGSDSGGHVITGALISPAEVTGDVSEIINFIRGL